MTGGQGERGDKGDRGEVNLKLNPINPPSNILFIFRRELEDLVHKETKVLQVHLDLMESKDQLDVKDQWENKVRPVMLVHEEQLVILALVQLTATMLCNQLMHSNMHVLKATTKVHK